MQQISLAIVGVQHPNKRGPSRRFDLALCRPGDPLELRPEPSNPHDPRAIAVFSERDVQLGYISAERASLIGKRIRDGGVVAVFQEATHWGAIARVAFDGQAPALPAARIPFGGIPDFYPDDIYPED
ncbi:HIRAN domain-containing protein [Sphingomonas sp. PvP055]|uniref:HIRAN domain-containing protein n=1 Tax=Sphingomonas sp. PvP055 TaxID=3156391 RepID=UPI00339B0384